MPKYTYKCMTCEVIYEQIRAMTAPESIVVCDACGKVTKRIYNIGAVSFNGSGFYSTDKKEK